MIRNCETCGKEFKTRPSRVKIGWGRFCSNKCRGTWYSKEYGGENSPNWKGGPTECKCEICGVTFFRTTSDVEKYGGKYCSRECADIGRRVKRPKYRCKQCGKTFIDRWYKKGQDRLFCSQKCMGEWYSENRNGELATCWKGGPKKYRCEWCGGEFMGRRSRARRFCSLECCNQWVSKNYRGEQHHAWLGGLSFEPYGIEFDNALRELVRERDGYVCQLCGRAQGKRALSVHHIDYDKNNNVEHNLISLCKSCHSKTNANRYYWQNRLNGFIGVIYGMEQLNLEIGG